MHIRTLTKHTRPLQRTGRSGIVFIPDISGFTSLVRNYDPALGRIITKELLATIIMSEKLKMEISEVEGDAILFFKFRSIPSVHQLCTQFDNWKTVFTRKVQELERRYKLKLDLHLKAIAHYGDLSEFKISGFRKLYGEVVIEAHRLLKNSIPDRSYLLMTDELMIASGQTGSHSLLRGDHSIRLCELYAGLRKVCYTYVV